MISLEIYRRRIPRKLICKSNYDTLFCSNGNLLEVGKKYTLVKIEIEPYNTTVWLEEFPGVPFNSVWFDEL